MNEVIAQVVGDTGRITLNRPKALNALSLEMIRALATPLLAWRDDAQVQRVMIRGQGKEGPFGAFCAGGDIRFFHQAALAGDPRLEDFFSEEYALNHLVHTYPKPYLAFLDGIVMGGGMGIAGHGNQRATRIVTERTKMAMPETNIGLFPDVGGGWFLAQCPGHVGEYLALTGHAIGAADAVAAGLADKVVSSAQLAALWEGADYAGVADRAAFSKQAEIDRFFGLPTMRDIVAALEGDGTTWAGQTAAALRQRSPLMLHVALRQVRAARALGFVDELRVERGLVRQSFHLRPGAASETAEGIRALAVDKDHAPRWSPARIEDVTPERVDAFFASPWPAHAHPLRRLAD